MDQDEEVKKSRLRDINEIDFGNTVAEISQNMSVVLTLYKVDDDPDIIGACKNKLKEGIDLLEQFGANEEAKNFKEE